MAGDRCTLKPAGAAGDPLPAIAASRAGATLIGRVAARPGDPRCRARRARDRPTGVYAFVPRPPVRDRLQVDRASSRASRPATSTATAQIDVVLAREGEDDLDVLLRTARSPAGVPAPADRHREPGHDADARRLRRQRHRPTSRTPSSLGESPAADGRVRHAPIARSIRSQVGAFTERRRRSSRLAVPRLASISPALADGPRRAAAARERPAARR